MAGFLIVNPRSGSASPSAEDLVEAARGTGIQTHVLRPGEEDAADVARRADAEILGMAGGDGSLAPVAAVAIDRDLPFVVVPFGTRNHFARDAGYDRDDPIGALAAFDVGVERRVDVGRADERIFLNNVSLGMYARLVHERESRRRRRDALARIRALAIALRHRSTRGFTVDGDAVAARILLVANNDYVLELLSVGERARLDEGQLHLYAGTGMLRSTWTERAATSFTVNATAGHVQAAIDGEPARLETPIEFRSEPQALRLLLPPRVEHVADVERE